MVTVITGNECIQFNLVDFIREKTFVQTMKYHKKNKTKKALNVKSSQFKGGEKLIIPADVVSVVWENRKYDTCVGDEVDKLINSVK